MLPYDDCLPAGRERERAPSPWARFHKLFPNQFVYSSNPNRISLLPRTTRERARSAATARRLRMFASALLNILDHQRNERRSVWKQQEWSAERWNFNSYRTFDSQSSLFFRITNCVFSLQVTFKQLSAITHQEITFDVFVEERGPSTTTNETIEMALISLSMPRRQNEIVSNE